MKLIFSLLIIPFLVVPETGHSEVHAKRKNIHAPVCYASEKVNKVYIPPPFNTKLKSAKTTTAAIEVNYTGFSEEAQAAFAYAVRIWEGLIESPVTIHIQASWNSLDTDILGSCSPSDFLENFAGAPIPNYFYPLPLAEKLAGKELNDATEADIVAKFNSSNTDWYFGTDGQTPADKYDFVTVALHEIAHGLGFTGLCFEPTTGVGAYGWTCDHPAIFDDFLANFDMHKLVDESLYANYSTALMDEFQSGYLIFNGEWSKSLLNEIYPRLYAPLAYDEGSSLYHLNELTFPSDNALMTPSIGKGEAIHDPGIALTMLEETGWIYTSIVHEELADTEDLSAPLSVTAGIVSDQGLDTTSVKLIYTDSDFTTADTLAMTWNESTDLFSADIPVTEAAIFHYYFTSQNINDRTYRLPVHAPNTYFDVAVGPDMQAPAIIHEPVKFIMQNNLTASITATVTDNIGVANVKIEYAVNEKSFQETTLEFVNQAYQTILTFSGLADGDSVRYRLIATDSSSQSNTTYLPTDGYYTISVEGFYPAVNTYINNFNTPSHDFISNDFYLGTEPGFDNGSLNSPHPYPSPNANDQSYNLTCVLKYPIVLAENGKMTYNEVVLVEPGETGSSYTGNDFWDYVIVEGSLDGKTSWLPLIDGYDSGENASWLQAFNLSADGNKDYYQKKEIILTENGNFTAGQTVYIRFRLYSDPYVNGWGWAIDDLAIQDTGTASETTATANGQLKFYPNPVTNLLTIEAYLDKDPVPMSYFLHTNTGQMILSGKFGDSNQYISERLDLSNLISGIYLMTIEFENGERISKKIIRK